MPKLKYLLLCFLISFVLTSPGLAIGPTATWPQFGKVINDTSGNTLQRNSQIIAASADEYFVAWEDSRFGFTKIFCQKISGLAKPLWANNGVLVCTAPGNQNAQQIISDGQGGIIIVWQDYRDGTADIYAQKITADGSFPWGTTGQIICAAPAGQFAPQLTTDGSGGAIITWHDYRSGIGEDIYAQKINSQGQIVWQENGLEVCSAAGTQWYPQIVSDGLGGAVIAWIDGRLQKADDNIYAQRINSQGSALWAKDGLAICSAAGNQDHLVLAADAQGVIAVWNDSRTGNLDIYAQKIDWQGSAAWDKDGIAVAALSEDQEEADLAVDGMGGAVIAWLDLRQGLSSVVAQRISKSGQKLWQASGRPISQPANENSKVQIKKLAGEEWVLVWQEKKAASTNLLGQKINGAGIPVWPSKGLTLAPSRSDQEAADCLVDELGQTVVVWQEKRFGENDIFAQKIASSSSLLWGKTGVVICNASGSVAQQNISVAKTKNQEIFIAWEDARSGYFNIYLQKIDRQGNLSFGSQGVAVAKVNANQLKPKILADDKGGVFVVWEDYRTKNTSAVKAQNFNAAGQPYWESSLTLAKQKTDQTKPLLVTDGQGGAIVAWEENRDILSLQDIYAQRISPQGKLLWGTSGKVVVSDNGDQTELAMASDGLGGAIFAWTDFRNGDRNPDILTQRLNGQGQPLWKKEGLSICSAPDIQRSPQIMADNNGGAIIAWTDRGSGSYDIYAQSVDSEGKIKWLRDGVPVNQLGRTQQNPSFGADNIIVWEDYRYGNWDIFAASLNSSGKLVWDELGADVAVIEQTQYSPQVSNWKDGRVIIAWEDYRSGSQYELYAQELDQNGKPVWPANGVKINTQNGARFPKLITDSEKNTFYVFWEDFTNGGRAIYGQRFIAN